MISITEALTEYYKCGYLGDFAVFAVCSRVHVSFSVFLIPYRLSTTIQTLSLNKLNMMMRSNEKAKFNCPQDRRVMNTGQATCLDLAWFSRSDM